MEAVSAEAASKPPRVRKPRRQRGLTESLLSIVLLLEAIVIFFVTLAVYGLHALPPLEAFVGGASLAILFVIATQLVRWSWGVWVGWVLQAALLATGILLPALYIVAAIFIAFWIFCFVRARQLLRQQPIDKPTTDSPTTEEETK